MRWSFVLACFLAAGVRAQSRHVGPFDTQIERNDPPAVDAPGSEEEGEEAESDVPESQSPEMEARAPEGSASPGLRYTADLSDAELKRRWAQDLQSLGSISVGFADQGRLINAVQMPQDEAWICRRSDLAWGTRETVDALALAFRTVHAQFPYSAPARLSHIGAREGGYLRPHRSHQSGRDADIGFFYKGDVIPRPGARRERILDPARNWALLKALITQSDVQLILVDRAVNRALHAYALSIGEDSGWLGRVFVGRTAIVQHAAHHRDHFHVRFYAPRSQELGRRILPVLSPRAEQKLAFHKVRSGQTLTQIARMYGSTPRAILKANRMRSSFVRVAQRLLVPVRKAACVNCPLPPPVVVPPRCLPPAKAEGSVPATAIASSHSSP